MPGRSPIETQAAVRLEHAVGANGTIGKRVGVMRDVRLILQQQGVSSRLSAADPGLPG